MKRIEANREIIPMCNREITPTATRDDPRIPWRAMLAPGFHDMDVEWPEPPETIEVSDEQGAIRKSEKI